MNNSAEQFKKLVAAVQDLSLARTMDEVTQVVRVTARELTGADGATFVLRHGGEIWTQSAPGKGAKFFFTIPSTKN